MSSTPEQLFVLQQQLAGLIQRGVVNFKKLGRDNHTPAVVRSRMKTMREYWARYQENNAVLESSCPPHSETRKEPYFEQEMFFSVNDFYESSMDFYEEKLAELTKPEEIESNSSQLRYASIDERHAEIKLPSINVPLFSGDYKSWENFRDLFVALVDSRRNLTDVQRLHYLKSSLIGDAALILKHTAITSSNYRPAWDMLNARYNNVKAMTYVYFQAFVDIPKVRSTHVLSDLKLLRDQSIDTRAALSNLDRPIDQCDDLFNFLVINKLDAATRREWEQQSGGSTDLPTFDELKAFLEKQVRVLEATRGPHEKINEVSAGSKKAESGGRQAKVHQVTVVERDCPRCKAKHPLFRCFAFKKDTCEERRAFVSKLKLCFNCFKKGHMSPSCNSPNVCVTCKRKHHTLLHLSQQEARSPPSTQPDDSQAGVPEIGHINHAVAKNALGSGLLPTAIVTLSGARGRTLTVRALLDQGSQVTCVTERVANALKLDRRRVALNIQGFGETGHTVAHASVSFSIMPRNATQPSFSLHAVVLKRLSQYSSTAVTNVATWSHLANLAMADPVPRQNAPIELLIGASDFGTFILPGLRKGPRDAPIAQQTVFGWVVSGSFHRALSTDAPMSINHLSTIPALNDTLIKFWELEELPQKHYPTPDELECERHFRETHRRQANGQYVVSLPFRGNTPPTMGDTYHIARRQFLRNEMRLEKQPALQKEYTAFMREYLALGHMQPSSHATTSAPCVFIPHLPVVRADSKTTKVRIVFNASCKSTNQTSLNDFLHIGPKLQLDPFCLLIRWREYAYVYLADLAKMFRQIIVEPCDRIYQQVLWRESRSDELIPYELLTVTYGTASAPYLANRVLHQLADDESHRFPLAAPIVKSNFYVDDALFGDHCAASLRQIRDQLVSLLKAGGFTLRKWASNHPELLRDISRDDHGHAVELGAESEPRLKVLGLTWYPQKDAFSYCYDAPAVHSLSKRSFLAVLASVYDPLGWIAPFLITGKIILQQLWLAKIDWDDPLPVDVAQNCRVFLGQLPDAKALEIPRWMGLTANHAGVELHGFGDASNAAYAAVIYLRVQTTRGVKVSLVCAKTRVAPLKLLTIPKLELCAAVLVCRTIAVVRETLKLHTIPVFCWSDSQTVLHWLKTPPHALKCFVANRVSAVQNSVIEAQWRHVPGKDNPADCASRGLSLGALHNHPLWWQGPEWLVQSGEKWPQTRCDATEEATQEIRTSRATIAHVTSMEFPVMYKFSRWRTLLRVLGYVNRFIQHTRNHELRESRADSVLTATEIDAAERVAIKWVQRDSYDAEMRALRRGLPLPAKSSLLPLTPILDEHEMLCVGGRLENASLSFRGKHPYIMPREGVAELLIRHLHLDTDHGGVQLTLRVLRERFWVIHARSVTRRIIHKCVVCVRHRAKLSQQLMGQLPAPRLNFSRAFAHVGVDYAGPLLFRMAPGRGRTAHKGYIALFVCMSVRAIHLELVSDYTTSAFLAAFKRFVARRGLPQVVYSDNGTNFVGADRELALHFQVLMRDPDLRNHVANDRVDWRFIPPNAPHFGGLWEAGVKSVKHHLRRVLGSLTPTFEELTTFLCGVEAILNSRPLTPASDDPTDCNVLTPSHFLIGETIKVPPEPSLLDQTVSPLKRWNVMQQALERAWRLCRTDYFNALQARMKWRVSRENMRVGDLVLINDRNAPPAKWAMGRVESVKTGKDGLVRVATIRTASSLLERAVTQLCKLPVSSSTA